MRKPVVLIAEELARHRGGASPDFEIRHCDGSDRDALLAAVFDCDALLIRSATTVDAEVTAAARNLHVIARAGVGLDNVDVRAATQAGVMVERLTANIVAAEMAIGLLLATARNITSANAALRAGSGSAASTWARSCTRRRLASSAWAAGILVAQRLSAFGMKVIAYDPYVPAARAAQMGVRSVSLDELLRESDVISVHLLDPGDGRPHRRAGAGEGQADGPDRQRGSGWHRRRARPCTGHQGGTGGRGRSRRVRQRAVHRLAAVPLRQRRRHTHLGASTAEAQEKAGVAVARSVRLALAGELVPDAVNVKGGAIAEDVSPASRWSRSC